jgi:steroid Delta-isomerase
MIAAQNPESIASYRATADRLIDYFEALSPSSLAQLEAFYIPHAYFKDPFNEVRSVDELRSIFSHMFQTLEEPRFVVTECIVDGAQCFLTWNFEFRFKRFERATLQMVRGGSHLKFVPDGRVFYHRDYWDAAEELYQKLPLVGGVMRWLKKRARS